MFIMINVINVSIYHIAILFAAFCSFTCILIHFHYLTPDKYTSHFGSGSQYAYYHEEDESSFQLVDTIKVQKSAYQRQRMRFNAALRARRDRDRRIHNANATSMLTLNKTQLQRERDRQRQIRKWQKQYYGRQAHDYHRRGNRVHRDASVQVQDTWAVLDELDFPRLMKLFLPGIGEPRDM